MGQEVGGVPQYYRASPLPDAIRDMPTWQADKPALSDGCYLIKYTPTLPDSVSYDGTIRLETKTGRPIASGDLYEHEIFLNDNLDPVEFVPNPAGGVPILPIRSYRFYLRMTHLAVASGGIDLAFEVFRFSELPITFFDARQSNWLSEGTFKAAMRQTATAEAYPFPDRFFSGEVADEAGKVVGRMTMGWVSSFLRKATVEIDRVAASEAPIDNGAGVDWKSVFDKVGWDITAVESDSDVKEPATGSWRAAEAHAAMVERREKTDLDTEWRYYVLAVRKIAKVSELSVPEGFERDNGESGYMYDVVAFRENALRREGLMVASDWIVPDKPKWGLVRGMRAAKTVNYFRTALHELGHAMGLRHNLANNGFMNTSEEIANHGTPDHPFPNNIMWSFAADDEHRLRHWPDLVVRPGGTPPESGDRTPTTAFKSERHRLDVSPLSPAVPLGAPVRIQVRLSNVTDKPVDSPSSLSLGSGFVSGRVIDPAGAVRTFAPLALQENRQATRDLAPGTPLEELLTLLQSVQGALFPVPGAHRIVVDVAWRGKTEDIENKLDFAVSAETTVTVTAAVNDAHRNAARKVLTTPEALFTLVIGGDHCEQGIDAIQAALESDVLRPHFAYIEAKRLTDRFFDRMPDFAAAAALIDDTTVMSPAEARKAAQFLRPAT